MAVAKLDTMSQSSTAGLSLPYSPRLMCNVDRPRYGRLGVGFVTVSAVCIWQGARIFLPDRESKRTREIEIKRDSRAEKEQVQEFGNALHACDGPVECEVPSPHVECMPLCSGISSSSSNGALQ